MAYEHIEFEIDQGVAVLRLNRPDSLNSFTVDMHLEVREVLTRAASDSAVRCVLLTGNGRGFCAGQDLNDRAVSPGESMPDLGDFGYGQALLAKQNLLFPVIRSHVLTQRLANRMRRCLRHGEKDEAVFVGNYQISAFG